MLAEMINKRVKIVNSEKNKFRVMGLDPGFACLGWSIVEVDSNKLCRVVAAGVFRTSKASKKQHVYAADDNLVRTQTLSGALASCADTYDVQAICAEAMSFPRSASVAAKIAMCWGGIAELARVRDLPVLQVQPQALKVAVCGSKTASKQEIQQRVLECYPEVKRFLPNATTLHEHVVDSCGAVVACLDSDVLRALRRAGGRRKEQRSAS